VNLFADVLPEKAEHNNSRIIDGATFAFAIDTGASSLWGKGSQVIWSPGEPLMLFAPEGTGKTTMLQLLIRARIGLDSELLGLPVAPTASKVLYVAADRPRQAGRSIRRMVSEEEREMLRERLLVHIGPLMFNLVKEPERLARWARDIGASDIFLDSLGALVLKLSDDETGGAVAQALQHVVAEGVEIVVAHHPRKATADNKRPNQLEDVYGSRWLTAPCGSVVCLWGAPGDPVVELRHLKTPADEVGPLQLELDADTGAITVLPGSDLLAFLRGSPNGLTAPEAARFMIGGSERAKTAKARRRLDQLVGSGHAHRREGSSTRGAIRSAHRYFAVTNDEHDDEHTALRKIDEHTTSTQEHADEEAAGESEHAGEHARAQSLTSTRTPAPIRGGVVPVGPGLDRAQTGAEPELSPGAEESKCRCSHPEWLHFPRTGPASAGVCRRPACPCVEFRLQ
jgi:hypothetical protein